MPYFSVILSCRDGADGIVSSLRSLRDQSFKDWEAICIDRGSTDETLEIFETLARLDRRFRVYSLDEAGASAARIFASKNVAKGRHLAFLEATDFWPRDRLAQLAKRHCETKMA